MLYFPTNTLFIEGPDCSGKTTLISKIHEQTDYKWHIFDRSQISRKIFCDLYKRKNSDVSINVYDELSNLNNRYVILVPKWEVIKKRYEKRGDEIHDLSSLRSVYDIFKKRSYTLDKYPNIFVVRDEYERDQLAENVSSLIDNAEIPTMKEISDQVFNLVSASGGESYPLQLTLYDDGKFEMASSESMNHPQEKEYYHNIFQKFHLKIKDELSGLNEYGRIETHTSRRFVYADDSCISFIQAAVRNNILDFHVVIRSSDVQNIFEHDLKFLYFLASTCYDKFKDKCCDVRMRFDLNSAHILE